GRKLIRTANYMTHGAGSQAGRSGDFVGEVGEGVEGLGGEAGQSETASAFGPAADGVAEGGHGGGGDDLGAGVGHGHDVHAAGEGVGQFGLPGVLDDGAAVGRHGGVRRRPSGLGGA